MWLKTISLSFLLSLAVGLFAQTGEVWFEPNRGQWDERIVYRVELQMGDFFIEKDGFTYSFSDFGEIYHAAHSGEEVETIKRHAVKSKFLNSTWQGGVVEKDSSRFYKNYLLGNDASKWRKRVRSFQYLRMKDFYPKIDLVLEINSERIKYSFEAFPGADISQIQIEHRGMDSLSVTEREVQLHTRFGPVFERDLLVWKEDDDGNKTKLQASFQQEGNKTLFQVEQAYSLTDKVIIDPSLTFSSFTGAGSDNWGFTAAPDNEGNLYGGGIVFGANYPVSEGAYNESFNGGGGVYKTDIGISKFSADGSELMYSTFLGGAGNETPNSIITNSQGELYILGITSSQNFPVSNNAFQLQHNGGSPTQHIALKFSGTDIIVSRLSADGTDLLASTYFGGAANDGVNEGTLNYNYGDAFRGEIILDKNGDVVFTSSTSSADYPTNNGAFTVYSGGQDAVVTKITPDLSTVIWSTFLGGAGADSGFSVQTSSSNNLFVTGGTNSSTLPFSGGYKPSFQGGISDGYVVELNGNTSSIVNGTYIGTSGYDQSFFVQLDLDDRVYVFGQSIGGIEVTPGVYTNPNSGQFIQQYSSDLSTLNWSTVVGGGNGVAEISPTAFLVSNCNEIYFTGWGGVVNHSIQAIGSTSSGFTVTADAHQTATNGNNFYIGVLAENASELNYATFMGGLNSSSNHVDGGTSRFDKQGNIYHAVCGACAGNPNGFTTTPGAYSETNNSSNCNMAVWKFDLGGLKAQVSTVDPVICLPDSVHFINESNNASWYHWDFGDGTTSSEFQPSHFYPETGTYEVMLVIGDDAGCFEPDTTYLEIEISDFQVDFIAPDDIACPGEPYQLEGPEGMSYAWSSEEYLDDPTIVNPVVIIDTNTVFTLLVSNECGAETFQFEVEVAIIDTDIIETKEICKGDTIQLWAAGGEEYQWSSDVGGFVQGNIGATVLVNPDVDANYLVDIITEDGCEAQESVFIKVFQDVPHPVLADSLAMCVGESIAITAGGAENITWSPSDFLSTTEGPTVVSSTPESKWYYVDFENSCGVVRDSVFVDVIQLHALAGNDTTICVGEIAELWAEGGDYYSWSPADLASAPDSPETIVYPTTHTVFTVLVSDVNGCIDSATVKVNMHPLPQVWTSPDYYGFIGDEVELHANASGSGTFSWSPSSYLDCKFCSHTTATPPKNMTYTVEFIDENGCVATDEVSIYFDGLIYVPNTFTPDGNEHNEQFLAVGGNIREFHMMVFNRWGELLFESYDMNVGWDGTYGGKLVKDGTYVWKISYKDVQYNEVEMVGHVNLLR